MLGEAATVVVTVTVILGSLAIAAVALRLYCRRLQNVPIGADDYCVLVALVKILTVCLPKVSYADSNSVPVDGRKHRHRRHCIEDWGR